ncbi:uncharacterized protein TNCV_887351 [Trichonephila clavipes]|uniref:Uncharacterized protein n=1 Tax=Trichonephila clavipes TaxID=2585209 RepID=A0A8X6RCJ6_TRICX|nr:uncharacterized protein TNCV_887351 [Trichonephila clavipes]
MPVIRDTGASLDRGCEKYATPEMFTGEYASVKHIPKDNMTWNEIQTSRQRRKETGKSTRIENEDDQFRLGECVVENGEDFVLSFTGEGTDNGNLVKFSDCEVMEAQLRNEESAPLIQGIENGVSVEASDQEGASTQLVPVRHKVSNELYIDTIGMNLNFNGARANFGQAAPNTR